MQTIYKLNAIPIKIPTEFLTNLKRSILNFMLKIKQNKNTRMYKIILYNKRTVVGTTIHDFKLYYTTVVIKPTGYSQKSERLINRIELKTQK